VTIECNVSLDGKRGDRGRWRGRRTEKSVGRETWVLSEWIVVLFLNFHVAAQVDLGCLAYGVSKNSFRVR
jgi:hypothetical protein